MAVDSYLDESGEDQGDTVIVSGYAGSSGHLNKLAAAWNKELEANDVPYFHTKHFRSPNSRLFKHLSASKRKLLAANLISLIDRRAWIGVTVCVDKKLYESVTSPRYRSQWGTAYTFCVQLAVLGVRIRMEYEGRGAEPLNVLLEDGYRNAIQAVEHVGKMKLARPDLHLNEYGLGSKTTNPVLQSADLLAYSSFEHHRGVKRKPALYAPLTGLKSVRHYWVNCTEDIIVATRSGVAEYYALKKAFREGVLSIDIPVDS